MEPSHSGRFAEVEVEHSAEALVPFNGTTEYGSGKHGLQQSVSQSLVISLEMIMRHVAVHGVPRRYLSEEGHPSQAFLFYRAHEVLPDSNPVDCDHI